MAPSSPPPPPPCWASRCSWRSPWSLQQFSESPSIFSSNICMRFNLGYCFWNSDNKQRNYTWCHNLLVNSWWWLTHWTEAAPQVVKIRAVFSIVTNSQWYWQLSEYWCQKDRKLFTFLCNQEIVKGDCVRWKTDANMLKRAFTSKSSNSPGSVAAAVNKEEQYLEPWLWFIIQACIKY